MLVDLDAFFFDLDDTLFDTTGLLCPGAHMDAARAMIAAGLTASLEEVLSARSAAMALSPDPAISALAARQLNCFDEQVALAGDRAFFERDPGPMSLTPDVAAVLGRLSQSVPLVLITSGNPSTQQLKVQRLGLGRWFMEVRVVPRHPPWAKLEAMKAVLEKNGWLARRCVVVGDRVSDELEAGLALGCRTVWVRREALPGPPPNSIDAVVTSLSELEPVLERLLA